jgi:Protein of unknown function (DUF4054)
MAITVDQFRQNFPEFKSAIVYPDTMVSLWLNFAYLLLSSRRWRQALDMGAQLYTAHQITLQGLSTAEGANGAPPGMAQGPISAKTVGELTINYDTAMGGTAEDGSWAQTRYGTFFVKLARQFGSGPVQTPPGVAPLGQFSGVFFPMGPAWSGPWYNNFSD